MPKKQKVVTNSVGIVSKVLFCLHVHSGNAPSCLSQWRRAGSFTHFCQGKVAGETTLIIRQFRELFCHRHPECYRAKLCRVLSDTDQLGV